MDITRFFKGLIYVVLALMVTLIQAQDDVIDNMIGANDDWTPVIVEVDGVEMVQVPSGCFMMGYDEGGWGDKPAHEVCLDSFWIDRYEITAAQFAAFEGEAEGSFTPVDDLQPRTQIDFHDANAYCELRSARLPTEAEWEFAARGPDGLLFAWGNELDLGYIPSASNTFTATLPVGSVPEDISWVGAYDMTWGVSEWIADYYDLMYYDTFDDVAWNPTGPDDGDTHAIRGRYIIDIEIEELGEDEIIRRSRLSHRVSVQEWARLGDLGFRCAVTDLDLEELE